MAGGEDVWPAGEEGGGMKLSAEQLSAAVDLLKRRVRDQGGPAAARAQELCAGELKGFVSAKDLLSAYRPDVAPWHWVEGDHERELDYYEPGELAELADEAYRAQQELRPNGGELEREVIARILRRLEAGGGLLRRKVRWVSRYHTLQPGEEAVVRKTAGQVRCGDTVQEWLERAVLIMCGERVVKVFAEHRRERVRRSGWNGSKKAVLEMKAPELDAPELALRRIAMSLAVLLRMMRRTDRELKNGAAIARAAGVTRANVSARQIKMEAEEAADKGGIKGKMQNAK